nr:hypothetical protein [Tanacetum cinerariifolium]
MKHTKLETQESSNKSVLGPTTVSDTELVTSLVPTEVKTNDQEFKIDELTKLVQMLWIRRLTPPKDSGTILYYMKCKKEDHRTLDHDMYITSLKGSQNYKAQPYQYASPSKQILKSKAKSYPLCTYYGFNDHHHDDYRNYPECEICESYNHFTSGYNRVIQVKGAILAESSQSSESSIRKISGQSKRITSHYSEKNLQTQTMLVVIWAEQAPQVKEYQKQDKIRSKPDKNGKRGEAEKSQKQLQWIKEEKLEWPEMKIIKSFIKERRKTGQICNYLKVTKKGGKAVKV